MIIFPRLIRAHLCDLWLHSFRLILLIWVAGKARAAKFCRFGIQVSEIHKPITNLCGTAGAPFSGIPKVGFSGA